MYQWTIKELKIILYISEPNLALSPVYILKKVCLSTEEKT